MGTLTHGRPLKSGGSSESGYEIETNNLPIFIIFMIVVILIICIFAI